MDYLYNYQWTCDSSMLVIYLIVLWHETSIWCIWPMYTCQYMGQMNHHGANDPSWVIWLISLTWYIQGTEKSNYTVLVTGLNICHKIEGELFSFLHSFLNFQPIKNVKHTLEASKNSYIFFNFSKVYKKIIREEWIDRRFLYM